MTTRAIDWINNTKRSIEKFFFAFPTIVYRVFVFLDDLCKYARVYNCVFVEKFSFLFLRERECMSVFLSENTGWYCVEIEKLMLLLLWRVSSAEVRKTVWKTRMTRVLPIFFFRLFQGFPRQCRFIYFFLSRAILEMSFSRIRYTKIALRRIYIHKCICTTR